ncbi:MAG: BtpA/SgcQ family protein, partial [bacterium]
RGLADALILSGPATGVRANPAELRRVKDALPDTPLLVGSGVSAANLEEFWPVADGWIVGTSLKKSGDPGQPVDPVCAREILAEASRLRRVEAPTRER